MELVLYSDLHLTEPSETLYQSLLRSLSQHSSNTHVIFAGDIFDVFSGLNPYFIKKHETFFETIKQLTSKGCSVFFIEGNHDLHLGSLENLCGARVCSEELELTLGSKRFYIAHGDLINQQDHAYLALRRFMRALPAKLFFGKMPGFIAEKTGAMMSKASHAKHSTRAQSEQNQQTRPMYHAFADQKFAQGFDFVLMGHCHDFDEYRPTGTQKQYLNTGYPPVHGKFMHWKEGDPYVSRQAFP